MAEAYLMGRVISVSEDPFFPGTFWAQPPPQRR